MSGDIGKKSRSSAESGYAELTKFIVGGIIGGMLLGAVVGMLIPALGVGFGLSIGMAAGIAIASGFWFARHPKG
jgi:hypothetical protein